MKTSGMAKKKPGPKPNPEPARSAVVTLKCRPGYKEWLIGFARAQRDIPSRLLDQGLIELAKKLGYEPPPER